MEGEDEGRGKEGGRGEEKGRKDKRKEGEGEAEEEKDGPPFQIPEYATTANHNFSCKTNLHTHH